jgi:hypothetical protein
VKLERESVEDDIRWKMELVREVRESIIWVECDKWKFDYSCKKKEFDSIQWVIEVKFKIN